MVSDSEIEKLVVLFESNTLESLALTYFNISAAAIDDFKRDRRENARGFKRDLLRNYICRGHNRKVILNKRNPKQ